MPYQLNAINEALKADPYQFVLDCEEAYEARIKEAAQQIYGNLSRSPIVLLSGPSGSGKTTTAIKLADELAKLGITSHAIALDNYFKTLNLKTAPRTPEGMVDYESPVLLDMELLDDTFEKLSRGEWVVIPRYEFARQMRNDSQGQVFKLEQNEVAIFEGIHALNDHLAGKHPNATTVYISARSNILQGDEIFFKGTWMRMSRRAVRDCNFRGTDLADTFAMWYNVRRGEKLYISPFKHKAQIIIDSAIPYEPALFSRYGTALKEAANTLPLDTPRYEEIHAMVDALSGFTSLDPSLVPQHSLLREFMGGGGYEY